MPYETAKTRTENERLSYNRNRLRRLQSEAARLGQGVRASVRAQLDRLRNRINNPYDFRLDGVGGGTPPAATIEAGGSNNLRLAYDGWPQYVNREREWSNVGKTWRQAYREHGDGIYVITSHSRGTHAVAVLDGEIQDTWDSRFYEGRQGNLVQSRVIQVIKKAE